MQSYHQFYETIEENCGKYWTFPDIVIRCWSALPTGGEHELTTELFYTFKTLEKCFHLSLNGSFIPAMFDGKLKAWYVNIVVRDRHVSALAPYWLSHSCRPAGTKTALNQN